MELRIALFKSSVDATILLFIFRTQYTWYILIYFDTREAALGRMQTIVGKNYKLLKIVIEIDATQDNYI